MFEKTETVTLSVTGMSCDHCRKRVEDGLSAVKGVKKARVDLTAATAAVDYVPGKTDRQALIAAVVALGYGAQ